MLVAPATGSSGPSYRAVAPARDPLVHRLTLAAHLGRNRGRGLARPHALDHDQPPVRRHTRRGEVRQVVPELPLITDSPVPASDTNALRTATEAQSNAGPEPSTGSMGIQSAYVADHNHGGRIDD